MLMLKSAINIIAATILFCATALAQDNSPPKTAPTPTAPTAKANPAPAFKQPTRAELLNRLFGRLHQAENDKTAAQLAKAIWRLWGRSGSITADIMLNQAGQAMAAKQYRIAIRILTTLIEIKPDFAEAWNRRATAYYLLGDYQKSQQDIDRTLELEPRHFGALSGRGLIMRKQGNKKAALEAYRRALAIYPRLPTARALVKKLGGDIERDI